MSLQNACRFLLYSVSAQRAISHTLNSSIGTKRPDGIRRLRHCNDCPHLTHAWQRTTFAGDLMTCDLATSLITNG